MDRFKVPNNFGKLAFYGILKRKKQNHNWGSRKQDIFYISKGSIHRKIFKPINEDWRDS